MSCLPLSFEVLDCGWDVDRRDTGILARCVRPSLQLLSGILLLRTREALGPSYSHRQSTNKRPPALKMDKPICAIEAFRDTPQQAAVCTPDQPVIPHGVAEPTCAIEALQDTPQQAAVCAPDPPVVPDGVAEPRR